MYDLVVADAALRNRSGRHHVGIANATIADISPRPLEGRRVIEANGALVTESFVNAHLHLDKV